VSRDLSEQKEMQEQREELLAEATAARGEAEKANRAKDDFLITLSHELRRPLAPILLWARALARAWSRRTRSATRIEAIVMSAESQLQLIDDSARSVPAHVGSRLLDKQSHSVEDVARAAIGVIGPSALAKGVTLDLDVAPDLGEAVLDRGRFPAGAVEPAVERDQVHARGRTRLSAHPQAGRSAGGHRGRHGQGIEPDFLPHLFQRFRQAEMRERRGTAESVSASRSAAIWWSSMAERSRGTATVPDAARCSSCASPGSPGGGAARRRPTAAKPDGGVASLAGLTVLLVEDDQSMRDVMRWTLEGRAPRSSRRHRDGGAVDARAS
jgi:hypothetical protein